MCGIAGIIDPGQRANTGDHIARFEKVLHHRGPDGFGWWTEGPVSLFHSQWTLS